MHLYLIRHAESENNARPEAQRVEDPELSPRGHDQAKRLAEWLRTHRADQLITSPFIRTLQTTRYAVAGTGMRPHVWCDVHERGGCYRGWAGTVCEGAPGLNPEGILKHLPEAEIESTIGPLGWWGCRPMESESEATERAVRIRARLEKTFGDNGSSVIAVIHADFKRCLLSALLETGDVERFGPLCNAGISYLRLADGRWQLHWLNSVTHLPSDLITGGL